MEKMQKKNTVVFTGKDFELSCARTDLGKHVVFTSLDKSRELTYEIILIYGGSTRNAPNMASVNIERSASVNVFSNSIITRAMEINGEDYKELLKIGSGDGSIKTLYEKVVRLIILKLNREALGREQNKGANLLDNIHLSLELSVLSDEIIRDTYIRDQAPSTEIRTL
jgi:hypothetical protein